MNQTVNEELSRMAETLESLKASAINSIEDAVPILSLLLSIALLESGRPLDAELVSESVCRHILHTRDHLYELLKANKYPSPRIIQSASFPLLVSGSARKYLEETRPYVEKCSSTGEIFSPWLGRGKYSDPDVVRHLDSLKLPRTDDLQIAMHNLGMFKQDPVLNERVERLFSPSDKFFINASGTGKSRLCHEGLCSNWGLYFTFTLGHSKLGSHDFELAIQTHCGFRGGFNDTELDDQAMREQNSACALRYFGAILLARLLVFQMFLETATSGEGLKAEHKARWLQTQLTARRSTRVGRDAFSSLTDLLVANDAPFLQSNIDGALRKIRTMIGPDEPLFIVLDEAHIACETLPDAFGDGKPLLWEIIRGWKALTRETCKFICVGTRIPFSMVADGFDLFSATGCFDDPDTHEAYINQFLPPKLRDSASGRLLVARLWRWCRGRYSLTNEFLSMLLQEGLEYPHNSFSHFVENATELAPLDALKTIFEEGLARDHVWKSSTNRISDFSEIPSDHKELLLEILYSYMSTHEGRRFNAGEYPALVTNEGCARFIDGEDLQIGLDEPLYLVCAARQLFPFPMKAYLRDRPHHYPSTFITSLRLNPPTTRKSLAHCLAFYITQVFGEPRSLLDIVDFPHAVPPWARQTAQLVRLFLDEQGDRQYQMVLPNAYESVTPLATVTTTLDETTRWISHEYGTAFCIPSSPNIDLLYALKLADNSFIWVAARLFATDEPVMPDALDPAISLLDIDSLFVETTVDFATSRRAADGLRSLSGVRQRPCVLRTISSFPVEVDLRTSVDKRLRDVAALSLTKLRLQECQVMQEDFFAALVNGVIAGTKRKSRWDDGSMHVERKRARNIVEKLKAAQQLDEDDLDYPDPNAPQYDPTITWDVRVEDLWEREARSSSTRGAVQALPSPRKPRKQKSQPSKAKPDVPVSKAKSSRKPPTARAGKPHR
ncbi:hypothetical protein MIND_00431600 [Mycena indigotica]|uniref:Uncharacterized protein n=1 Tax=Mycena indigotica TaxID=2126181 RepID=A0A8H6W5D2_9AGAR|nr:uncharacterized protein MIND_00431600 [Mycena indigotica]KAF7306404.1 hypothetical protein MIND_00431600 [Mycena indigotica]